MSYEIDEFKEIEEGDAALDYLHHVYCPMNKDNKLGGPKSTLCMCFELKKADREAIEDERYERSRDWA